MTSICITLYFGPKFLVQCTLLIDIIDSQESRVFHQDGVLPVKVGLWRTLEVARILHLTPFILLGKVPWTKFLLQIICWTLFLLPQQVLFLSKHQINFIYFEVFSSLLHLFALLQSHFPLHKFAFKWH